MIVRLRMCEPVAHRVRIDGMFLYSKTCHKCPLKNKQNKDLKDRC